MDERNSWLGLEADPEPEWPGELPEIDQDWNQFWFMATYDVDTWRVGMEIDDSKLQHAA
jgi:hypothetical protein